jgi:DeoR/GlpR family transcriptional regulator of sugar metabolism
VFFIIIELGAVGPSRIAKELSVGLSTVYRDLGALEKAGLIRSGSNGRRLMTDMGLKSVDLIIDS